VRKLGLALLSLPLLAAGLTVAPAHAAVRHVTLGGVRVALHDGTRQVVTVNHTRGYHAQVASWTFSDGRWHRVSETADGRIGYGGLVAPRLRVQGSGTTPLGTVRLISSFGRHPRGSGWDLPYRRIRAGDYWVEDNRSRFYNRYRNKSQGGFRWWLSPSHENGSERLRDYPRQYEFSIVTDYNYAAQVRHRGAGIFLHVNGSGATAGCVSAPRRFVLGLMRRLDPDSAPVMAVGR
jgi:L,D-peptidoglycan transpeptidase YkuD (ErfK/YbiS/YcfS/YnhG family)